MANETAPKEDCKNGQVGSEPTKLSSGKTVWKKKGSAKFIKVSKVTKVNSNKSNSRQKTGQTKKTTGPRSKAQKPQSRSKSPQKARKPVTEDANGKQRLAKGPNATKGFSFGRTAPVSPLTTTTTTTTKTNTKSKGAQKAKKGKKKMSKAEKEKARQAQLQAWLDQEKIFHAESVAEEMLLCSILSLGKKLMGKPVPDIVEEERSVSSPTESESEPLAAKFLKNNGGLSLGQCLNTLATQFNLPEFSPDLYPELFGQEDTCSESGSVSSSVSNSTAMSDLNACATEFVPYSEPMYMNPEGSVYDPETNVYLPASPPTAVHGAIPIPCKFGDGCIRSDCKFLHSMKPYIVKSCRLSAMCLNEFCQFSHPKGRPILKVLLEVRRRKALGCQEGVFDLATMNAVQVSDSAVTPDQPDQTVDNQPDQTVDNQPDQTVDNQPDQTVDNQPDQTVDNQPDQTVDNQPDQTVDNQPDQIDQPNQPDQPEQPMLPILLSGPPELGPIRPHYCSMASAAAIAKVTGMAIPGVDPSVLNTHGETQTEQPKRRRRRRNRNRNRRREIPEGEPTTPVIPPNLKDHVKAFLAKQKAEQEAKMEGQVSQTQQDTFTSHQDTQQDYPIPGTETAEGQPSVSPKDDTKAVESKPVRGEGEAPAEVTKEKEVQSSPDVADQLKSLMGAMSLALASQTKSPASTAGENAEGSTLPGEGETTITLSADLVKQFTTYLPMVLANNPTK